MTTIVPGEGTEVKEVGVSVGVWHPLLRAEEVAGRLPFLPLVKANRGDRRGKSGAVFLETYCRFDVVKIAAEREADLVEQVISSLGPLHALSALVESGGRVWVTVKIPRGFYELSLTSDEMARLGAAGLGLSFDIS